MVDKNKIILVIYINIENIDRADVPAYLNESQKALDNFFDNSVLKLFVPVRNQETRIECINPKLVSEEEYKNAVEITEDAKKKLDEFLNSFNNENK